MPRPWQSSHMQPLHHEAAKSYIRRALIRCAWPGTARTCRSRKYHTPTDAANLSRACRRRRRCSTKGGRRHCPGQWRSTATCGRLGRRCSYPCCGRSPCAATAETPPARAPRASSAPACVGRSGPTKLARWASSQNLASPARSASRAGSHSSCKSPCARRGPRSRGCPQARAPACPRPRHPLLWRPRAHQTSCPACRTTRSSRRHRWPACSCSCAWLSPARSW
mmetsp:Transcript_57878/g.179866  ORF Transcript_57878/g.179866 Transcript_57878/m.179866 type:complete len:223 (+) Transcript_57878:99-767(+)